MNNWYIKRDNKQAGPFDSSRLKVLAAEGKVKPDDLVRREDQEIWHKASKLKGLFGPVVDTPPTLLEKSSGLNCQLSNITEQTFNGTDISNATMWYISRNSKLLGPFSFAQLKSFAKSNKLKRDDYIRKEDESDFIKAHSLTGLFPEDYNSDQAYESNSSESSENYVFQGSNIPEKEVFYQNEDKTVVNLVTSSTKKIVELFAKQAENFRTSRESTNSNRLENSNAVGEPVLFSNPATENKSQASALSSRSRLIWKAATIGLFIMLIFIATRGSNQNKTRLGTSNHSKSDTEVLDIGGFGDLQKAANQMTDTNIENASLEHRRAIAQAKENKERDEREKERNKQFMERTKAEQKERDIETALQKERTQKERLEFIEKCMTNISYDTQNIIVSKKLRNSGATVELLGKSIPQFKRLHNEKDWLKFFSFAQNYRYDAAVKPFKWEEYPEQSEVFSYLIGPENNSLLEFQSKESWAMLIKTTIPIKASNDYERPGQSLFVIYLPLSLDRKIVWPSEYKRFDETMRKPESSFPLKGRPEFQPKRTTISTNWKKHPDGGSLFQWAPLGLYLVGVSQDVQYVKGGQFQSEADMYFTNHINGRLNTKISDLRRKNELGQIDDSVFTKEVISEVKKIYEDAVIWLEEH